MLQVIYIKILTTIVNKIIIIIKKKVTQLHLNEGAELALVTLNSDYGYSFLNKRLFFHCTHTKPTFSKAHANLRTAVAETREMQRMTPVICFSRYLGQGNIEGQGHT